MDVNTADILRRLNNDFYRENAESFSDTRQHSWPGWRRFANLLDSSDRHDLSILDVACGNMRFEAFCQDEASIHRATFCGIDSCASLARKRKGVQFIEHDIIGELLADNDPLSRVASRRYDATVCFGFMHHVPGFENRARLLESMVDITLPDGLICCSFWRFMSNEKISSNAIETTEKVQAQLCIPLESNDFILGWQNKEQAYRYCHHFDEAEIDALAAAMSAKSTVLSRFKEDGRSGNLNEYLVLKRI